eukprot:6648121-Prymnesium_polylepis.1
MGPADVCAHAMCGPTERHLADPHTHECTSMYVCMKVAGCPWRYKCRRGVRRHGIGARVRRLEYRCDHVTGNGWYAGQRQARCVHRNSRSPLGQRGSMQ